MFDEELTLDNFGDYIYFKKSAVGTITMMVDIDGKNNTFDKVAIAEIYASNTDATLSKLNQGEGLIL